jgi:hypothetical protein
MWELLYKPGSITFVVTVTHTHTHTHTIKPNQQKNKIGEVDITLDTPMK